MGPPSRPPIPPSWPSAAPVPTAAGVVPPAGDGRSGLSLFVTMMGICLGLVALSAVIVTLVIRSSAPSSSEEQLAMVLGEIVVAEDFSLTSLEQIWTDHRDYLIAVRSSGPDADLDAVAQEWLAELEAESVAFNRALRDSVSTLDTMDVPEDSDADRIRDLAVRHYSVWITYTDALPDIGEEWSDQSEAPEFDDYIDSALADVVEEINASFDDLCALMLSLRPEDESVTGVCSSLSGGSLQYARWVPVSGPGTP